MSNKHLAARHDRLRSAAWKAHDALHRDDVDTCHGELHRALGIRDEDELPTSDVARAPGGFEEFDAAFRKLCLEHGIAAAFVAQRGTRLLSGGVQSLVGLMDRALRRELVAQQSRRGS